jgi:hypothetical protein
VALVDGPDLIGREAGGVPEVGRLVGHIRFVERRRPGSGGVRKRGGVAGRRYRRRVGDERGQVEEKGDVCGRRAAEEIDGVAGQDVG